MTAPTDLNAAWIANFRSWLAANPLPTSAPPVTPTPSPTPTPTPTPTGTSVKALDMTDSAPLSFFQQAHKDGYRLYVYPPLSWGVSTPRSDAQALFKAALDAGLKVGIYSRDPRWWNQAINAVENYTKWCAEVDFCSSAHIVEIVEDAIKAQLDMKIERRRKRQEAADKKWFRENG